MDNLRKNYISVCLVVYNAQDYIRRCLESVKNIADEIIIVIDGVGLDQTHKICKKYTDYIIVKEHLGLAELHLISALKAATGDWILTIDADEYLSEKLKENIRDLVCNKRVAGYRFLWPLYNGRKYITKYKPFKLVLARKKNICYLGVPHAQLKINGTVITVNFLLEHRQNYNKWTLKAFKQIQIPRAKIHAKTLLKNFADISKFQIAEQDWSIRVKFRKRFCFLFPLFGFYKFCWNAFSGEWWNLRALKVSFFNGLYEAFLGYFILKYRLIPPSRNK